MNRRQQREQSNDEDAIIGATHRAYDYRFNPLGCLCDLLFKSPRHEPTH